MRTLRDMTRDLTNATFKDNRTARPQESQSYSSTLANPSVSPDYSRNASPVLSDRATGQLPTDISSLSLSVNYLPSKFSSGVLAGGGEARRRPATRDSVDVLGVPKMGGGIDVFRSGEARMGGEGDGNDDEDDDDDDGGTTKRSWFVRGRKQNSRPLKRKLRWNKFKWILFAANTIVSLLRIFFRPVFYRSFFFQVDRLLVHSTYFLSLDVVRRLGSCRRYPCW